MKKILILLAGFFIPLMAFAAGPEAKIGESELVVTWDIPVNARINLYHDGSLLGTLNGDNAEQTTQIIVTNGNYLIEARTAVYDAKKKEHIEDTELIRQLPVNVNNNRLSINIVARKIHSKTVLRDFSVTNTQMTKASNPDNADIYYNEGESFYKENKRVDAAWAFERCLDLDPAYRRSERQFLSAAIAAKFGILTTESIGFDNYSLFLFLGFTYYDTNKEKETLENALAAFRQGYEIDIINAANDTVNIRTVYLVMISTILETLGRVDEATAAYQELGKVATLDAVTAFRITPDGVEVAKQARRPASLSLTPPTMWEFRGPTIWRVRVVNIDGTPTDRSYSMDISPGYHTLRFAFRVGNNVNYDTYVDMSHTFKGGTSYAFKITSTVSDPDRARFQIVEN